MISQHYKEWYFDLVSTIVPGPSSLSYFIPLILLVVGLQIPSTALSYSQLRNLFIPIIFAATVHSWICMQGPDVISTDTLWWSLFFLAFRNPRHKFKRLVIRDQEVFSVDEVEGKRSPRKPAGASPGHNVPNSTSISPAYSSLYSFEHEAFPSHFFGRLKWTFILLSSRPLTSWMTGDTAHDSHVSPPNVSRTRRAFVYSVLKVLVPVAFIVMPLALKVHAYDENCMRGRSPSSYVICDSDKSLHLLASSLNKVSSQYLLRPLILGAYLYSLMILLFMPPYLIPVFTNYLFGLPSDSWSPHTWPRPHFGPFTSVLDLGLRGLWGKWWHQQMRHAVSEPGRQLAIKLKLERGGLARYMAICISAFLLSGLTHMGLVPPEPKWAQTLGPWSLRLRIAGFFWVQPVGIFMEVILVEPAIKRLVGSTSSKTKTHSSLSGKARIWTERCSRLAWVLVWMAFSLTFLLEPFSELCYWSIWPSLVLSVEKIHNDFLNHWLR